MADVRGFAARSDRVIAIATEGGKHIHQLVEHVRRSISVEWQCGASTLRPASLMSPSKIPESRPRNRFTVPRWMAVTLAIFIFLTAIPLAHGVLPWAISTLLPRYGWVQGSPGFWNRIGLIPVAIGAALLIWILVSSIAQTPDTVRLGLTPSFLNLRGPYRFTRNPMYVAELGLWLGWALFFGSAGVFIGFVLLLAVVSLVILPREERGLEAAFGQVYLQYKERVPRWLGKANR